MANDLPMIAGDNINCARFVNLETANKTVYEANAGDTSVIGISTEAAKSAPQTGASTYAAVAGDQLRIHMLGENCLLKIGSGGVTVGCYIKPDNDGQGVIAATGNAAFAMALEAASEGELAEVLVLPYTYAP